MKIPVRQPMPTNGTLSVDEYSVTFFKDLYTKRVAHKIISIRFATLCANRFDRYYDIDCDIDEIGEMIETSR
jgi:hypothetical protein